MKNMLNDAISCLKGTQISKRYDSEMKLSCPKCESSPLVFTMKGDFTVNGVQILAAAAVMTVMCVSLAVAKKLKS